MEAKVMMIKCQKNRKAFGARIQKEGPNWRMTWAFKIDERIAQKEKFSSEWSSNVLGYSCCNGQP